MTSRLGRIPTIWWLQSALAGLGGGLAMALSWNIGSALAGQGFWSPLNILGRTLAESAPFPTAFGAHTVGGAFFHLLTAMAWGVVFSAVIGLGFPRMMRSATTATLSGLAFGVFVFLLMGQLLGPRINPNILLLHFTNYFIGHLVFGAVTGLLLYLAARRQRMSVTFGPELVVHRTTRA